MPSPRFRSDGLWNCPSMAGPDGPLLNLLENLKPLTAVEAPKATTGMKVTDLPNDLLISLPYYLGSLDDWYAVIRTCRRFYHTCVNTKATFPAFFVRSHKDGLLSVHRDLLMAGSARQVADWAVRSQQNRQELWDAIFTEGEEGLLKLSVEIARWTVEDVRALHKADLEVIEPLVEDIAAHIGAKHRPGCSAERTSRDECTLCTDLTQARTSLYSFVIYCNLFHADIEESYGQLALKDGFLGSEFRSLWMEHRMYKYEWEQNVMVCHLDVMDDNARVLRRYFNAQSGHENVKKKEVDGRFKLFSRIMDHQGLDTLRSVLPNGAVLAETTASSICSKVWALPLDQVSEGKVWDRRNKKTRKQIGWYSITCDEAEHWTQHSRHGT